MKNKLCRYTQAYLQQHYSNCCTIGVTVQERVNIEVFRSFYFLIYLSLIPIGDDGVYGGAKFKNDI